MAASPIDIIFLQFRPFASHFLCTKQQLFAYFPSINSSCSNNNIFSKTSLNVMESIGPTISFMWSSVLRSVSILTHAFLIVIFLIDSFSLANFLKLSKVSFLSARVEALAAVVKGHLNLMALKLMVGEFVV